MKIKIENSKKNRLSKIVAMVLISASISFSSNTGIVNAQSNQSVINENNSRQAQKKGWLQESSKWYYYENGNKKTGWLKDTDGSWYWLKSDGVMASNETLNINGKKYEFLTSGKMIDENSTEKKIEKVLDIANKQIGKPYVWGASGPNSFDCSGLTYYVYKNGSGVTLPRSSREQAKVGSKVEKKNLKSGDLVFFNTGGAGISHVGMYIGSGKFIHSTQPGDTVKIHSMNSSYYVRTFVTARRVMA